jgi:hypothetical protein
MQELSPIMQGQICPYCDCATDLVDDKEIYGPESTLERLFFRCKENHDHYVGTYKKTGLALGRLADRELRKWKMEGHNIFDPMWKNKEAIFKTRLTAYQWLSEQMNLPLHMTHFGMFDIDQCKIAIQICRDRIMSI